MIAAARFACSLRMTEKQEAQHGGPASHGLRDIARQQKILGTSEDVLPGACAIGIGAAWAWGWWLLVFVVAGAVFVPAYNLELAFHTDWGSRSRGAPFRS